MKATVDLARAELKKLFFSPVALLILMIFFFYAAAVFTGIIEMLLRTQNNFPLQGITGKLFGDTFISYHKPLLSYIYLFFPLLTMNIFSRDQGSGAINLLLSSPVRNREIVLGKYFSLVIFSMILLSLIAIFDIYSIFRIEHVDTPIILSGLLGMFLLCCTYSAIGMFMSSLTNHPIVAAIGTLCVLLTLNFIGNLWQEQPFVRDITYWLSLRGKMRPFIDGIIPSEDLIYFLALILFFISITIIRLRSRRVKRSRIFNIGQYIIAVSTLCAVAWISSRPQFKKYADVTRENSNTLTEESQEVVKKLTGGLTITTYSNLLDQTAFTAAPSQYKTDVERFELYTRFKPEIEMNYVYYYKLVPGSWYHKNYPGLSDKQIMDSVKKSSGLKFKVVPYSEIADKVDLSGENYRFVRLIERENGQKTFLRLFDDSRRHPDESEITAALKRLVDKLPKVGFVAGHGERSNTVQNDRGYSLMAEEKTFRYSLLNNGFDFEEVSLAKPIPQHISILVIADARRAFSEQELQHYQDYLNRGGNLIIASEPDKQEFMQPIIAPLGVGVLPGQLASQSKNTLPDLLPLIPIVDKRWDSVLMKKFLRGDFSLMMNGVSALTTDSSKGFTAIPLFTTDTSAWNEVETKDFLNDSVMYNPSAGEIKKTYVPVMALERKTNGKTQKILVTGDADWISNAEVLTSRKSFRTANFAFARGAYYWLSDNIVPIKAEHEKPIDNRLNTTDEKFAFTSIIFQWILPAILLAAGLFVLIRRKGR